MKVLRISVEIESNSIYIALNRCCCSKHIHYTYYLRPTTLSSTLFCTISPDRSSTNKTSSLSRFSLYINPFSFGKRSLCRHGWIMVSIGKKSSRILCVVNMSSAVCYNNSNRKYAKTRRTRSYVQRSKLSANHTIAKRFRSHSFSLLLVDQYHLHRMDTLHSEVTDTYFFCHVFYCVCTIKKKKFLETQWRCK